MTLALSRRTCFFLGMLALAAACAWGCGSGAGTVTETPPSVPPVPPPDPPPDPPPLPPSDVSVSVEPSTTFQTMQGFGTSERVFDDPHLTNTFDASTGRGAVAIPQSEQAAILDALYVELGLTRVRPATEAGVELVNDNGDPDVTDLTKFDFSWKRNDSHIDYVKEAMARGVTTHFLSPIVLETWMDETNPEEYVEWAMAILRRWRDQGVEPPYYSIMNEPGYPRGGIWSGEYIRDVVKLLGAKLASEGFSTKIVIPDDVNPDKAYDRAKTVLDDPDAAPYVGALAYHLYDGGSPAGRLKLKDLAAQYGIPVWMSEFWEAQPYDWANLIQDLVVDDGVSAVDAMWGFFGQWDELPAHLIEIRYSGDSYVGWVRTKKYYYTGQFSRFILPGAVRIASVSDDVDVKVSTFQVGTKIVAVLINNAATSLAVRVDFPADSGLVEATGVRTSASEDWAAVGPFQVVQDGVNLDLPGQSVTTITVQ